MTITIDGTNGISPLPTTGNLNFTGTGNRITGDFSNATVSSRVTFQTSTTNGNTNISAVPNGTSTTSWFKSYASADPTNSVMAIFGTLGNEVRLASDITGTGTYQPLTIFTGGAERVRIDTSGNLGIGTSSPARLLHVAGTSRFDAEMLISSGASLRLIESSNNNSYLLTNTSNNLTFVYNSTERMRIDNYGNLLVGTSSDEIAGSKLTVVGGTTATAVFKSSGTGNNTYPLILRKSDSTNVFFVRSDGAINTGVVYSAWTTAGAANANIGSDGYLYRSTSSLKYKINVQDATHGLAELLKLRSVTYNGKAERDGDTVFGGLVAEEVHAAGLYEFVQYADDGTPDALAYGNMVSLCIKAIQELKAEVDELKAKAN
jgi:hypothetical protein